MSDSGWFVPHLIPNMSQQIFLSEQIVSGLATEIPYIRKSVLNKVYQLDIISLANCGLKKKLFFQFMFS